jgi:hypothetical protein
MHHLQLTGSIGALQREWVAMSRLYAQRGGVVVEILEIGQS